MDATVEIILRRTPDQVFLRAVEMETTGLIVDAIVIVKDFNDQSDEQKRCTVEDTRAIKAKVLQRMELLLSKHYLLTRLQLLELSMSLFDWISISDRQRIAMIVKNLTTIIATSGTDIKMTNAIDVASKILMMLPVEDFREQVIFAFEPQLEELGIKVGPEHPDNFESQEDYEDYFFETCEEHLVDLVARDPITHYPIILRFLQTVLFRHQQQGDAFIPLDIAIDLLLRSIGESDDIISAKSLIREVICMEEALELDDRVVELLSYLELTEFIGLYVPAPPLSVLFPKFVASLQSGSIEKKEQRRVEIRLRRGYHTLELDKLLQIALPRYSSAACSAESTSLLTPEILLVESLIVHFFQDKVWVAALPTRTTAKERAAAEKKMIDETASFFRGLAQLWQRVFATFRIERERQRAEDIFVVLLQLFLDAQRLGSLTRLSHMWLDDADGASEEDDAVSLLYRFLRKYVVAAAFTKQKDAFFRQMLVQIRRFLEQALSADLDKEQCEKVRGLIFLCQSQGIADHHPWLQTLSEAQQLLAVHDCVARTNDLPPPLTLPELLELVKRTLCPEDTLSDAELQLLSQHFATTADETHDEEMESQAQTLDNRMNLIGGLSLLLYPSTDTIHSKGIIHERSQLTAKLLDYLLSQCVKRDCTDTLRHLLPFVDQVLDQRPHNIPASLLPGLRKSFVLAQKYLAQPANGEEESSSIQQTLLLSNSFDSLFSGLESISSLKGVHDRFTPSDLSSDDNLQSIEDILRISQSQSPLSSEKLTSDAASSAVGLLRAAFLPYHLLGEYALLSKSPTDSTSPSILPAKQDLDSKVNRSLQALSKRVSSTSSSASGVTGIDEGIVTRLVQQGYSEQGAQRAVWMSSQGTKQSHAKQQGGTSGDYRAALEYALQHSSDPTFDHPFVMVPPVVPSSSSMQQQQQLLRTKTTHILSIEERYLQRRLQQVQSVAGLSSSSLPPASSTAKSLKSKEDASSSEPIVKSSLSSPVKKAPQVAVDAPSLSSLPAPATPMTPVETSSPKTMAPSLSPAASLQEVKFAASEKKIVVEEEQSTSSEEPPSATISATTPFVPSQHTATVPENMGTEGEKQKVAVDDEWDDFGDDDDDNKSERDDESLNQTEEIEPVAGTRDVPVTIPQKSTEEAVESAADQNDDNSIDLDDTWGSPVASALEEEEEATANDVQVADYPLISSDDHMTAAVLAGSATITATREERSPLDMSLDERVDMCLRSLNRSAIVRHLKRDYEVLHGDDDLAFEDTPDGDEDHDNGFTDSANIPSLSAQTFFVVLFHTSAVDLFLEAVETFLEIAVTHWRCGSYLLRQVIFDEEISSALSARGFLRLSEYLRPEKSLATLPGEVESGTDEEFTAEHLKWMLALLRLDLALDLQDTTVVNATALTDLLLRETQSATSLLYYLIQKYDLTSAEDSKTLKALKILLATFLEQDTFEMLVVEHVLCREIDASRDALLKLVTDDVAMIRRIERLGVSSDNSTNSGRSPARTPTSSAKSNHEAASPTSLDYKKVLRSDTLLPRRYFASNVTSSASPVPSLQTSHTANETVTEVVAGLQSILPFLQPDNVATWMLILGKAYQGLVDVSFLHLVMILFKLQSYFARSASHLSGGVTEDDSLTFLTLKKELANLAATKLSMYHLATIVYLLADVPQDKIAHLLSVHASTGASGSTAFEGNVLTMIPSSLLSPPPMTSTHGGMSLDQKTGLLTAMQQQLSTAASSVNTRVSSRASSNIHASSTSAFTKDLLLLQILPFSLVFLEVHGGLLSSAVDRQVRTQLHRSLGAPREMTSLVAQLLFDQGLVDDGFAVATLQRFLHHHAQLLMHHSEVVAAQQPSAVAQQSNKSIATKAHKAVAKPKEDEAWDDFDIDDDDDDDNDDAGGVGEGFEGAHDANDNGNGSSHASNLQLSTLYQLQLDAFLTDCLDALMPTAAEEKDKASVEEWIETRTSKFARLLHTGKQAFATSSSSTEMLITVWIKAAESTLQQAYRLWSQPHSASSLSTVRQHLYFLLDVMDNVVNTALSLLQSNFHRRVPEKTAIHTLTDQLRRLQVIVQVHTVYLQLIPVRPETTQVTADVIPLVFPVSSMTVADGVDTAMVATTSVYRLYFTENVADIMAAMLNLVDRQRHQQQSTAGGQIVADWLRDTVATTFYQLDHPLIHQYRDQESVEDTYRQMQGYLRRSFFLLTHCSEVLSTTRKTRGTFERSAKAETESMKDRLVPLRWENTDAAAVSLLVKLMDERHNESIASADAAPTVTARGSLQDQQEEAKHHENVIQFFFAEVPVLVLLLELTKATEPDAEGGLDLVERRVFVRWGALAEAAHSALSTLVASNVDANTAMKTKEARTTSSLWSRTQVMHTLSIIANRSTASDSSSDSAAAVAVLTAPQLITLFQYGCLLVTQLVSLPLLSSRWVENLARNCLHVHASLTRKGLDSTPARADERRLDLCLCLLALLSGGQSGHRSSGNHHAEAAAPVVLLAQALHIFWCVESLPRIMFTPQAALRRLEGLVQQQQRRLAEQQEGDMDSLVHRALQVLCDELPRLLAPSA